jgi:chromosome partitioning protein
VAQRNCTVAFVTAKGGSGKSTLACCLAAELVNRNRRVTLIDADPQGGMTAWHGAGGPLQALTLIAESSQRITEIAREAAKTSTVIVDAAGFATSTTIAVLEAADLLVIPCRASGLDPVRAIEMVTMANEVAKAQRRKLPSLVVLNGVTHTAIVPHIRAELEAAGVTVAVTEIGQRTAYAVASLNGSAPCWMGSTAEAAAKEMAALAHELKL